MYHEVSWSKKEKRKVMRAFHFHPLLLLYRLFQTSRVSKQVVWEMEIPTRKLFLLMLYEDGELASSWLRFEALKPDYNFLCLDFFRLPCQLLNNHFAMLFSWKYQISKFVFLGLSQNQNFNTLPSFLPMFVAFCASWESTCTEEGHGKIAIGYW